MPLEIQLLYTRIYYHKADAYEEIQIYIFTWICCCEVEPPPPPKYVGYTVKMTFADMDTDRLVLISKLTSF